MDLAGAGGLSQDRHHVCERALVLGQEPDDDLSPEAWRTPPGGDHEESGELGQPRCLEVDHGRLNAGRQTALGLGVQSRRRNRPARPSLQKRPGPYKILVHAVILAWTSANWVAHTLWRHQNRQLLERVGRCNGQTDYQRDEETKHADTPTQAKEIMPCTNAVAINPVKLELARSRLDQAELPSRLNCL